MEKTIVIQAGGTSSRMGRDKGLLVFRREPLVMRVHRRLQPLGTDFLLVTNQMEAYRFTGLPLVGDVLPGKGALGGLLTAMQSSATELIGVAACDMPFVSSELFRREFEILEEKEADAVLPSSGDGLEPFHAVYRREACLKAVRAALERGESKAISWLPQVKTRIMPVDEVLRLDPELRAFININTPDELAQAEALS